MCDVCFDKEVEVECFPCEHRICAACKAILLQTSHNNPCIVSELCDGAPLICPQETLIQNEIRLALQIKQLEEEYLSSQLKATIKIDMVSKDALGKAVSRWVKNQKKSWMDGLAVQLRERIEFYEQNKPIVPDDGDCIGELYQLTMRNNVVTKLEYWRPYKATICNIDPDGKLTSFVRKVDEIGIAKSYLCETITDDCEFLQIYQLFNDRLYVSFEDIRFRTELSKHRVHSMCINSDYYLNCVERETFKIKNKVNELGEKIGRQLKLLERKHEIIQQRIEQSVETVQDSEEPINDEIKKVTYRFAYLEKSELTRINQSLTALCSKIRELFRKGAHVEVAPILVRRNLQVPWCTHALGGLCFATMGDATYLCGFSGDPIGLGSVSEIYCDLFFFKDLHSLGDQSPLVLDEWIHSSSKLAMCLSPGTFGNYRLSTVAFDINQLVSPWRTNRSKRSYFVHEPTRTIYMCGARTNEMIPFAFCEY